MRFVVSRTSLCGHDEPPPCDNAYRLVVTRIDARFVSNPKKLKGPGAEAEWYANGMNHRVINRRIARDFDDTVWCIDIDTLSDLLAFTQNHGDCIIGTWMGNGDLMSIEIYDGYRE